MAEKQFVAVLSGDLVKSKGLKTKRTAAVEGLLHATREARSFLKKKNHEIFFSDFYRGDSFQCALPDPEYSLWTAVFLRSELTKLRASGVRADVRIGLGLGSASEWNEKQISSSDGEAFRLSGKALDLLKSSKEKYRRLRILTPTPQLDMLLSVWTAFLDAVIQRWTQEQAEAVSFFLKDKTQEEISRLLKVKQPAVQRRLQTAGHFALKEILEAFPKMIYGLDINLSFNNPNI